MPRKCPCGKFPTFNFPGEKQGICCSSCKKEGMIDVFSKRCPCGKRPTFNFPDEKTPICYLNNQI